jgi:trk system potassium uptake protein
LPCCCPPQSASPCANTARRGRFVFIAILLGSFAGLVYLANRSRVGRTGAFSHPFFVLTAAYIALPLIMAIPLTEAVPGLTLFRAWFEMTASFTTTGASLLGDGVPVSVHVWRALVAWAGGAFVLVYALAILAPLNLGGFEVLTTSAPTPRRAEAVGRPFGRARRSAIAR